MNVSERISGLRKEMRQEGIDIYIVPTADYHHSEYVGEYFKTRKFLTGFTGSAGTAVITLNKGGLWTDSRYFLQAEAQLKDTGIVLFKDRLEETPSIAEWLGSELKPQDKVGIDGWVNAYSEAESLRNALATYGIELTVSEDPFQWIWKDRPALPLNTPFILPLAYAGVSASEKLDIIRNQLSKSQADGILISALDEIAWTLNLRGDDIHCNPVFISYLLVTQENATLYIIKEKLTPELTAYLDDNKIGTCDYTQIENDLRHFPGKRIQLSSETNLTLYLAATQSGASIVMNHPSPVCLLKAIKNGTEIEGFRQAMKRDGVAMVRFLMWLEQAVPNGQETEISIDQKLYELRAQQALFHGISFDTIAGYQEHGAIVHYEATPQTAYTLKPEGLLLLDSGAQYTDGTTDITRTIALGPVSEAQRIDYTLVLKGFIALSQAEFPQGTCGTQLDVLARQYMWKAGINYGHGTGHGVGHFLNVHEGPHQVRMNHMPALLQPGMTLTNEPGIYKAGRYGVRTENTMLIIESQTTEFGKFYKFEPLTLCPIDKTPICTEMLTPGEKQWLNEYHAYVYAQLSPLLNEEEKAWLAKATSEI